MTQNGQLHPRYKHTRYSSITNGDTPKIYKYGHTYYDHSKAELRLLSHSEFFFMAMPLHYTMTMVPENFQNKNILYVKQTGIP